MGWDEAFEFGRPSGDKVEINSPVTVTDGSGRGCGGTPTISLEAYTDYVLRKFQREREWGRRRVLFRGREARPLHSVARRLLGGRT